MELLHKGVAAWNRRDLDGYLDLMDQRLSGTRALREWRAVHFGAARG